MSDILQLSLAEASARLAAGTLTSSALVEACLARIGETNARLGAVITVADEPARAAAARADVEIAAGRRIGPLHGIPIGYKDIYATAGLLTTGHSRLLETHVPAESATAVARLEAAGGITLAKLATHEFANGGPSFDLPWPPARNPWNVDHVPGGSSSGSGAAVAAGLCFAALGSDTGGSIRSPAGLCGIAGLKPSYGLVSRRGVYPLAWTLDHAGPMARSVEDCAMLMQALAGYDAQDPASVDCTPPDFTGALERPLGGLRIGVARSWYDHADGADGEVRAAVGAVAAALAGSGLDVRDVELPDVADYHACGRIIILSEAYSIHRKTLIERPETYGELFRQRVRLGAFIDAADYLGALRLRRRLTDAMLLAMERQGIDVILTANQYGTAESFSAPQKVFPFFGKPYLTMPFNVTGMPALTVCAGFARNGLPIGVQLAGRPFEDDTLLAVGHAYEMARGPLDRWPSV
jgi:aspartyl-tRNA(Asn)/glutamyl-tRNA(Gln) amidotransferase subunit A